MGKSRCLRCSAGPEPLSLPDWGRGLALTGYDLTGLQTPWKVLLGLLGLAALVTVITVPAVLLNKGSKFETFANGKRVETSIGSILPR